MSTRALPSGPHGARRFTGTPNEWRLGLTVGLGGALFALFALFLLQEIAFHMANARMLDGGQAFWSVFWTATLLAFCSLFFLAWGWKRLFTLLSAWIVGYGLLWLLGVLIGGIPFWLYAIAWAGAGYAAVRLARGDRGIVGRSLRGVVAGAPLEPWGQVTSARKIESRLATVFKGADQGRIPRATLSLVADLVVQAYEVQTDARARLVGSLGEFATEALLDCFLKNWYVKGRTKRLTPAERAYFVEAIEIALMLGNHLDQPSDHAVFRATLRGLLASWYASQPQYFDP